MVETNHKCPCPSPAEGKGFSFCEVFDCRITQPWCEKCRTLPNWRAMYEGGRGPLQDGAAKARQKAVEERRAAAQEKLGDGPGTELLKMLKRPVKVLAFVFPIRLGCGGSCLEYAIRMNAWGCAGCRERIEEIIDHLKAQAAKMKMPFNRSVAKLMVYRAIRRAEKAERCIMNCETCPPDK